MQHGVAERERKSDAVRSSRAGAEERIQCGAEVRSGEEHALWGRGLVETRTKKTLGWNQAEPRGRPYRDSLADHQITKRCFVQSLESASARRNVANPSTVV